MVNINSFHSSNVLSQNNPNNNNIISNTNFNPINYSSVSRWALYGFKFSMKVKFSFVVLY